MTRAARPVGEGVYRGIDGPVLAHKHAAAQPRGAEVLGKCPDDVDVFAQRRQHRRAAGEWRIAKNRQGVDLVEDHVQSPIPGPGQDLFNLIRGIDRAQGVVGRGEEQDLDWASCLGDGAIEPLRGQAEFVVARAVNGDDLELITHLKIHPEAGIARGRHQDPVAGIGENVKEDLEHTARPGEDRYLVWRELPTEERPTHEPAELLAESHGPGHGVIAEHRWRDHRDLIDTIRHQIRHQLVLGDTQTDVPIGVGVLFVPVFRALEVTTQVLGEQLAGEESLGAN